MDEMKSSKEFFAESVDLLNASNLRKVFFPTVAVNNIDINIHNGDILALVGANGAGKSTLINVLSGVVRCDEGELIFDGKTINLADYSPAEARNLGIRVVHQELSLCKNLTVYENFYVEQSQSIRSAFGWRKQAQAMAKDALERVFPENGIDVKVRMDSLSIAQQQMVEIARATSDVKMKLMILDEPTSSLPLERTEQLQKYLIRTAKDGMSYIYISHRLKEIMTIANRVLIMQNGAEKWRGAICETSEEHMLKLMGEAMENNSNISHLSDFSAIEINKSVEVVCSHHTTKKLRDISFEAHGGQILGLTGLEGNGQLDLLNDVFLNATSKKGDLLVTGKVAYVAGDRKKEGIFPLWSIADNQVITKAAGSGIFKHLGKQWIQDAVGFWYNKLHIKSDGTNAPITSLSGGNQQKVLIARALAADVDIILLDDPTRGVDQPTKNALYEVFCEAAVNGKLVIWRTSDDEELKFCTNLLVLNSGCIAGAFKHNEIDRDTILELSFTSQSENSQKAEQKKRISAPLYMSALLAMIAIYGICAFKSPMLMSGYGLQLMVVGFAALMLCALGQTFIIGLGHIDLGIGNFCGLVNVVCCTVLFKNPIVGTIALLGLFLSYPLMGYVIYKRNVPAIIVTLGMSFVWIGVAICLQAIPGGACPAWIRTVFYSETPILNTLCFWLLGLLVIAILFYRSRYGTVLRGFGNNEKAMVNSGWSRAKAYMAIYTAAGFFAFMAGITTSAINNASDSTASSTYTMLSVASVIIGGGYFSGGIVTHFGTVCGAVILTMISVLLGLLSVSTDYTALIQGLILILILSLRLLKGSGKKA